MIGWRKILAWEVEPEEDEREHNASYLFDTVVRDYLEAQYGHVENEGDWTLSNFGGGTGSTVLARQVDTIDMAMDPPRDIETQDIEVVFLQASARPNEVMVNGTMIMGSELLRNQQYE